MPSWQENLAAGHVLVIDGGMGTELQRRGVPMDEVVWSGAAVLSHPEVVRAVHEDYIRAGADVIITNTFGSTRQMLGGAGLGDQVEQVHRRAVALAQEARDATARVAIAGSLSPSPPGFDHQAYPPPDEELAVYRESAQLLADSGVDLIALEMLEDTTHAPLVMRAALDTGLPVWLGVSCRRVDGRLVRFSTGSAEVLLAHILDTLVPMGPDAVTIMHSEIDAVSEAIAMVEHLRREHYVPRRIEMRGCHPRDLIDQVVNLCRYQNREPEITTELLDVACLSYFIADTESTSQDTPRHG